jgi:hypothetical protein
MEKSERTAVPSIASALGVLGIFLLELRFKAIDGIRLNSMKTV